MSRSFPVVTARCCRDWPVAAFMPIGRCGLCGRRPTVVPQDPAATAPWSSPTHDVLGDIRDAQEAYRAQ